jgi:hypothetical protein
MEEVRETLFRLGTFFLLQDVQALLARPFHNFTCISDYR